MEWTLNHWLYLFLAVAHPASELIRKTNLRSFLNEDYYHTNREDFPIPIRKGKRDSFIVLILLVLPFFFFSVSAAAWYFVLGLAVADVIQHFVHLVSRPRQAAPLVHLITIAVFCHFLWRLVPDQKPDVLSTIVNLVALIIGALIILLNWWKNSSRVRHQTPASAPA